MHYFGNQSEKFYENELNAEELKKETEKIKQELEKSLKGKPEELQKKMIRGKLKKYLEDKTMEHQRVGFEESEQTIGEYLEQVEKKNKTKVRIVSAQRFGL